MTSWGTWFSEMAAHGPRTDWVHLDALTGPSIALWEILSLLDLLKGPIQHFVPWTPSIWHILLQEVPQGKEGAFIWQSDSLNSAVGLWPWEVPRPCTGGTADYVLGEAPHRPFSSLP